MADFDFVETDSAKIYTTIIGQLMDYCNEPLYPGDERRIFGEGLVQVLVGVFSLFDDKAKQRTLRYARGSVLDAIGDRYGVERAAPSNAFAVFRRLQDELQNIIRPSPKNNKETSYLPALPLFLRNKIRHSARTIYAPPLNAGYARTYISMIIHHRKLDRELRGDLALSPPYCLSP